MLTLTNKYNQLFKKIRNNFKFYLWVILCITTLSACGGGGSGSGSALGADSGGSSNSEGDVIIGLTDAEGDFHSYAVDVISLSLTHVNGSIVETLPLTTRVDFAEYTELTEFLTAATVPSGIYSEASLQLDFSNAEIYAEDASGDSAQVLPVDANGDPLGLVDLTVVLSGRDNFRIAPGIPAHITMDFDLEASNEVDFSVSPALVTVNPILIADTILESPKRHRVRGLLNEVSVPDAIFSVHVRPFYHHGGEFGSVRVHTVDETNYEIDGTTYVGVDGLQALSLLDPRSPVIASGGLNDQRQFVAGDVLAGTSVPWGDKDWVQGSVIARNGNTLTLSAVRRIRHDNQVDFFRTVDVTLAATTAVTKQDYVMDPVDISDISVGQRLRVAGDLEVVNSTAVLDASNGDVRMLLTHLAGQVSAPGPLTVDVQSFDGRRVSLYDFNGTGTDLSFDAVPDYYEIDTGSLNLNNVDVNDPIRVIGHVTPFGTAPEDFDAFSVIDYSELPSKVLINWVPQPSIDPFISISSTEVIVDMSNPDLGNLHKVVQAGISSDLTNLGMDVTLSANNSDSGLFTLSGPQHAQVFNSFEDFSVALLDTLDGTVAIQGLHASGQFDDSSTTLTLRTLVIRVREIN